MNKTIFILYTGLSLLLIGCSNSYNEDLVFIEPNIDDNFEFPYYLFIPKHINQNERVNIIIEPNNSGFADDDLQKHIEKAEKVATNDYS